MFKNHFLEIIEKYLWHYTLESYQSKLEFLTIISGLSEKVKKLALFKYRILRIIYDDFNKIKKNEDHIKNIINEGK